MYCSKVNHSLLLSIGCFVSSRLSFSVGRYRITPNSPLAYVKWYVFYVLWFYAFTSERTWMFFVVCAVNLRILTTFGDRSEML